MSSPSPSPLAPRPSRLPCIVIDPGHGKGNRKPGVFDPGAVRWGPKSGNGLRAVVATEAEIALQYAAALADMLAHRGVRVVLTRNDQRTECSLGHRLQVAARERADVLVSLHLNADPDEDNAGDPEGHGHEVLYGNVASARLAREISNALTPIITPHAAGVAERPRLAVLKHQPLSVLIELGFIDSDDYFILADAGKKLDICEAIAGAITAHLAGAHFAAAAAREIE